MDTLLYYIAIGATFLVVCALLLAVMQGLGYLQHRWFD